MRPLQAHGHRGLGTLYAKIDHRQQARTELSTAIALYRAMDDDLLAAPGRGRAGAGGHTMIREKGGLAPNRQPAVRRGRMS